MLYVILALVILAALSMLLIQPRRRKGQPFDWTHRRRWWRPRWAFPDDR